jgi:serine/threonine protein kinase
LVIPRTLAHYEILEKIGSGGMGEVYRARDPKLDRDVAIKILPPSMAESTDRLGRFEQEARSAGTLNHPNLVTIYELGTHEGSPYIVMELIEGQTLRDKLGESAIASSSGTGGEEGNGQSTTTTASGTILPIRKTIEYAVQLAHGLAAAHDKGITHRDLKPENVLISKDGRVKILDFGLAKLTEPVADGMTVATPRLSDTEPGTVLGTVGYMSPEQVRGEMVDHRSDIFSLGVILYEMLSGKRAFHADSSVQTLNAILTEDPPNLAGDGSRVSPPIDRVVRRCLEKQKEERFQSGHDLAYALEAVGDSSIALPSVVAPGAGRMRPLVLGAGTLALIAASFLAGRTLAPPSSSTTSGGAGGNLPRVLPLTFEQGTEIQPNLSPDGRSFVFVSRKSGNLDIYFQRVGGENAINLTADSEDNDSHPVFSPDGEQIAFRSERDGGGIYVMGATGESVRRLTDFGFNPTWSPDGAEIAVAGEAILNPFGRLTISNLWRINVGTGDTTRIHIGDAVQPNWSPSGKWIAFWGLPEGTGKRTLYTISLTGGDPVPLTDDNYFNWNPVWSSDERSLYFSSNRGGTMDLWRMPMDPVTGRATGDPEPATISSESSGWLSVSRDGSRVIYTSARSTQTLSRLSMDPRSLRPIGEPELLFRTSRALGQPRPSPDGQWLLMTVSDPNEDLMICRSDGTGIRRITNDPFKDREPVWSWDGNTIIFFSDRTGRYEIWSIRLDGSGLTQITETTGENIYTPIPSSDGRFIAALSSLSGAVTSGLIDLDRGLPVRELEWFPAIDSTHTFVAQQFAADGRRLLGVGSPGWDLFVYSLDTKNYQHFPEARGGSWLPDGQSILYMRDSKLFRIDTQSGEIQELYEIPEDFQRGPQRLSWDFKSLYYMQFETESDIWMLDYGDDTEDPS